MLIRACFQHCVFSHVALACEQLQLQFDSRVHEFLLLSCNAAQSVWLVTLLLWVKQSCAQNITLLLRTLHEGQELHGNKIQG